MDDRASDIELLAVDVLSAAGRVFVPDEVDNLDEAICAWRILNDAYKAIAFAKDALADKIGQAMGDKRYVTKGCTIERNRVSPRRTNWDHDALLRLVVDSRIVNEETGEIESTLDVLRKVYPLKGYNARTTALRELNINPDEFCETEYSDRYALREFSS
jgi:hypothetical protein